MGERVRQSSNKNYKKSIAIGISIVALVGFVIVFTNIDDLVESGIKDAGYQIETLVSQVEIITDLESLNPLKIYSINTKCEMFEGLQYGPNFYYKNNELEAKVEAVVGKKNVVDWTVEKAAQVSEIIQQHRKELEERNEKLGQKYNDRLYDYAKEHGLKWHDDPGKEWGPADVDFMAKNRTLELLEMFDANPNLLVNLGDLETWVPPYVLTKQDVRDDPECVERVKNSSVSYNFVIEG